MILMDIQIRNHTAVDSRLIGILFPDSKICFHRNDLHPVQCHHIKLPDGFVVFRRIPCRHDDPSRRYLLIAKAFALQKLQHGGRQRLRYTVDLIDKQDSFRFPGSLHLIIDGGYDLTHGIFRYRTFLSPVFLFPDKRQTDGALTGVMSDSIGNQCQIALSRDLFHNLCLSDTGRSHQQNRSLPDGRDQIIPEFILL